MWINQYNMPLNSRLKDNPIVLILHNLQMSVEFSDQLGENDTGTVVEITAVICLDNLTDNVKRSYHDVTLDNFGMTGLLAILALEVSLPSSIHCRTLR
jgi:hypothetical protein